jgi:predicted secreted protein
MFRVITLIIVAVVAMPAVAQNAPAPAAQAAPVKEKKICRTETNTGSIMPRRTCKTQAEWDQLANANRGTVNDLRQQQQISQMTQSSR